MYYSSSDMYKIYPKGVIVVSVIEKIAVIAIVSIESNNFNIKSILNISLLYIYNQKYTFLFSRKTKILFSLRNMSKHVWCSFFIDNQLK